MDNFWEAYFAEVDQDNDNYTEQTQNNPTAVVAAFGDVEDVDVENVQANKTEQSNDAEVDVDGPGYDLADYGFPFSGADVDQDNDNTTFQTQANPTIILAIGGDISDVDVSNTQFNETTQSNDLDLDVG